MHHEPSGQSDNNLTTVSQVIVLGTSVGLLRYSSGVSRAYFVNLYSFTWHCHFNGYFGALLSVSVEDNG